MAKKSKQSKTLPIYILNGPNLNLLGTREPETYGHATLADVEKLCAETAAQFGLAADCRQSNREGELIVSIDAPLAWVIIGGLLSFSLPLTLAMVFLAMLVRWTIPRFRYDQLMDIGWKWLIPMALTNIVERMPRLTGMRCGVN